MGPRSFKSVNKQLSVTFNFQSGFAIFSKDPENVTLSVRCKRRLCVRGCVYIYIYLADFGDILFTIFLQKDPSWDTGYVTNPASFGTAFAQ